MAEQWIHDDWALAPACSQCYADQWESDDPKPCATPDPDPASPCGYRLTPDLQCSASDFIHGPGLGLIAAHPHVPTLCRCGHGLEAVR